MEWQFWTIFHGSKFTEEVLLVQNVILVIFFSILLKEDYSMFYFVFDENRHTILFRWAVAYQLSRGWVFENFIILCYKGTLKKKKCDS